jgi:DNA replication protein DnaC
MKKIFKKALQDLAVQAVKDLIQESGIIPMVKESIKSSFLNTIKIYEDNNYLLFKEVENFLLKKYSHRFQNLNTYIDNYALNENNPRHYDDDRYEELLFVRYGIENGRTLIKEDGIYIWVDKSVPEKKETVLKFSGNDNRKGCITLTTLKKDKETLLKFLIQLSQNSYRERIKESLVELHVVDEGHWMAFKKYKPISFDNIVLPLEIKKELTEDIDNFIEKKDWYSEMGLSFKRGYLLYGAPRNGKSSLITAIARKYKMNVYYLNLNSMISDNELMRAFTRIPNNSIVAVEDIDTIWDKRTAKNPNCKINIETFMNILSGAYERDGLLYFFTTNYIENLDEALIGDRRIDKKIHITNPKKAQVEEYLTKLYEFPIELKSYNDESRSMGNILNLFERYEKNPQELIKILEKN